MKKLSLFLAAVSMLWVLSACGGQPQADSSTSTPEAAASRPAVPSAAPQPVQDNGPLEQGNILIAYFSLWDNAPWEQEGVDTSTSASVVVDESGASGTTRYVAQMIRNAVGGDIHAILTVEPYPADFDAVVSENHGESSRAISSTVENMEQYDVVFIGFPVWATTLPQAVRTFLSEYDFSGKIVIPFCTHDGYGTGSRSGNAGRACASCVGGSGQREHGGGMVERIEPCQRRNCGQHPTATRGNRCPHHHWGTGVGRGIVR